MRPQDVVICPSAMTGPDVGRPQGGDISKFTCQFGTLWGNVNSGRTQAAFTSHKGLAQSTCPVNNRSRGCRARKSPFSSLLWQHSFPHAPKSKFKTKLFTLMSLPLRWNPSTKANTSKVNGRAHAAVPVAPALFLSKILNTSKPQPFNMEGAVC